MPRFKDVNWNLPHAPGKPDVAKDWTVVEKALLMDIRDELKQLNALLHCENFVGIPRTLKTISRKIPTRKPRRRA